MMNNDGREGGTWTSKFISILNSNNTTNKSSRLQDLDFQNFLTIVKNESIENMYNQGDFDEDTETRPTYEQVSYHYIVDEANKNLLLLRSMENILYERIQAYSQMFNSLSKTKSSFDVFHTCEGTLRQSFDLFFVFYEQELQQSRQQMQLTELKKEVTEMKLDAQQCVSEYQKYMQNIEKDVVGVEKKLSKSKESLEKYLEIYNKFELLATDTNSLRNPAQLNIAGGNISMINPRDCKDAIIRYESEIRDDIRNLLQILSDRDQVWLASRKAFQALDYNCKKVLSDTLKKLVEVERHTNDARHETLAKFEQSITNLNVNNDVLDFVVKASSRSPPKSLVLHSQALSFLDDIARNKKFDSMLAKAATIRESKLVDKSYDISTTINSSNNQTPVLDKRLQRSSQWMNALGNAFNSKKNQESTNLSISQTSGLVSSTSTITIKNPIKTAEYDDYSLEIDSQASTPETTSPQHSLSDASFKESFQSDSPSLSKPERSNKYLIQMYLYSIFNTQKCIHNNSIELDKITEESANNILEDCKIKSASTMFMFDNDSNNNIESNTNFEIRSCEEAITWLSMIIEKPKERGIFITELNHYRSKKVDIGEGFYALAYIIWFLLRECQLTNDVQSIKVIMMLIQTFYRIRDRTNTISDQLYDDEGDVSEETRGVKHRQYLKEVVVNHNIWQESKIWEQILWRLAIEQLQTVPYSNSWYDMSREGRIDVINSVHNVIFSQVMAITHSMMELGCQKPVIREFVYRMCVIHQLNEQHRQQMLAHIIRTKEER